LTAGVAVAKVLQTALGLKPVLKWPNDILLDNQKVGGILVESAFVGDDIEYAVVGLGINANSPLADFPDPLQSKVTTLQEQLRRAVDLPRLFGYLVGQLEFWYMRLRDQGFKAIEPHYRRLCGTLGTKVTIDLGDSQVTGMAEKVDSDGSLILQTAQGRVTVRSGDVISSKSDDISE
jgi:BirA family biotin operon repressor/biotin-[acetyl-CoA-carboxylase] ligase